jgi:hypothetical protein
MPLQDCEYLQESHLNLIQELPQREESAPQQIQMPCVKTISPAQPQYGAVQPASNNA